MSTRMKEAASLRPAARDVDLSRKYGRSIAASRANWLEQAADVLLLLAFWPASQTARVGFSALLDRRLRRAYEEVTR